MADFPIKYTTKTLTKEPFATRAQPLPPTGQAQVAQAWGKMGKAIFDIGLKIQKAEDAMELSTLQLDRGKILNATFDTLSTTQDPIARAQVFEKGWQDIGLLQSKRENVNNEFRRQNNQLFPSSQMEFLNLDRNMRIQGARDQLELNGQTALEDGNLSQYYTDLKLGLSTGLITQVEYDFRVKNAPIDTQLAQARVMIGENNPQGAITMLEGLKDLSGEQLDHRDKLLYMARQQAMINTDAIQNEITFGMFENRNLTLAEKATLGEQYINKLKMTSGLSASDARVMTNQVEDWMSGKERTHDPILYTNLSRKVTQLKRGLGKAEVVKKEIVNSYSFLDDAHFEKINKYFDTTVEGWNADILRRLEKEAMPHLAPNLSMLEKFMEMPAGERVKHMTLIDKLQEPAKVDADRLSLYLDQCRKWIEVNPTAPDFYENGRRILGQFERYTDEQIRQMEKRLESGIELEIPKTQEIPVITSDAERDALPSGTLYRDPSGNLRRKQ